MARPSYSRLRVDFDNLPFLTNPRRQLDLEAVALGLIRIPAGKGYTFTHHHEEQEEVYVVLEGTGVLLVEGELLPVQRGDIFRVSPEARRALKADDQAALLVICAGAIASGYPRDPEARYTIDDGVPHYDDVPPWYAGDAEVAEKNAMLRERMESSRRKREERAN